MRDLKISGRVRVGTICLNLTTQLDQHSYLFSSLTFFFFFIMDNNNLENIVNLFFDMGEK